MFQINSIKYEYKVNNEGPTYQNRGKQAKKQGIEINTPPLSLAFILYHPIYVHLLDITLLRLFGVELQQPSNLYDPFVTLC